MEKGIQEKYTAVIGLEVHAQLLTQSKIYNSDSAEYGCPPNTNVGVITLGHPGVLPKLNKKAVEFAIKMGIASHSDISRANIFDRKNYFYPDLPKGYQITQDRTPICIGGYITINSKSRGSERIRLNRIHLEEDAGKSIHLQDETDTLVDFNRSGVALIEIVTQPEIHYAEQAFALLCEIRRMVRYLDICDGNMEEGSLRCDANVSVMLHSASEFGKKVEVKNMNSMRSVQRAIDYEIERQIALLEKEEKVRSETRTFDAETGKTFAMRAKEELNDYRYFPDPDLSPMEVSEEWLNQLKESMPPLPQELYEKFMTRYLISAYDAQVLTDSRDVAMYFDKVCQSTTNYKAAANWVMGPVKSYLNEQGISADQYSVTPKSLAEVIELIDKGKISFSMASQRLFPELLSSPEQSISELLSKLNLTHDSDEENILPIVEEVLKELPLKVAEYKNGRKGILGLFMGEVKRRTKGKADPKVANDLLIKKLSE